MRVGDGTGGCEGTPNSRGLKDPRGRVAWRVPAETDVWEGGQGERGAGGSQHRGMGRQEAPDHSLTCRIVDRGPSRVEWILGSRTTRRVHVARLRGCGASFGVLGVWVHWLYWDACHWDLLA